MQVIELTCKDGFKEKHNCGMMLTKKEREIIEAALEEYVKNNKRKKVAARFYKYLVENLPL